MARSRYKSPAQKKRETVGFSIFLIGAGGIALVAMFGQIQLRVMNGVVMGTMRGGTAVYVPPGSTQEKPVVSWFHSSGRDQLTEGTPVAVILYPDGGHATSKHPTTLAFYCGLGGLASMALDIVFLRYLT